MEDTFNNILEQEKQNTTINIAPPKDEKDKHYKALIKIARIYKNFILILAFPSFLGIAATCGEILDSMRFSDGLVFIVSVLIASLCVFLNVLFALGLYNWMQVICEIARNTRCSISQNDK